MKRFSLKSILFLAIVVVNGGHAAGSPEADSTAHIPPVAVIPGLTAEDAFPRGCVGCHVDMPQINQDERLSSIMSGWDTTVDEELLEKVRNVAAENFDLKGKHPRSAESFRNIPAACIACHNSGAAPGVPFASLMHVIHLSGQGNHFLSIFRGECTHCHKFDAKAGTWSIPSGPEQ